MRQFEKTNIEGFVKDKQSTAILNNDSNAYQRFLLERERELRALELEKEVSTLRNDMSDIKKLLQQLVNGTK